MNNRAPIKPLPGSSEDGSRRTRTVQVPIKKGHLKRAVRLAEAVHAEGRNVDGSVEEGVVLMTAMLLVERLAEASGCEPIAVLRHMAECLEIKQAYVKTRSGFLT